MSNAKRHVPARALEEAQALILAEFPNSSRYHAVSQRQQGWNDGIYLGQFKVTSYIGVQIASDDHRLLLLITTLGQLKERHYVTEDPADAIDYIHKQIRLRNIA